ncbi:ATP-dependent zinc metalloprotease FtsH,ATP-dependent metalloprotease,Ribosome-associated chaperone zuotin,ATP-dependent metallopeptidase HflB,Peptidase family M41 [Chlamydia poikilotherma]|uniref:ATP-dependent zinc metalloprotease FtsH n=1 Tax=Chlamydia poikilotherma TaxID=1967783 RepID=A0A3B0PSR7_9CHLA|nr:ATP-dependent zinc metalloprotease FtsH [Chlamydia poikilotherma]SYX09228.1 ATP-dependent zinc metalloprotease FtsH,ATP-dependent metalloprotease,Ribosome-associated chaperone zuotin,ATP-dependent metallopeptidase HflB,Peptidase family M41 [Chlamydia poikilotherma]
MSKDKKMKPESKKNFPTVFFFLLFGVIFGVIAVQNFLVAKKARVSFSHQLEHLVNLKLIYPEDSRKIALNDNLVSFSGRFRESPTAESQLRYHYLELINQRHQLEFDLQEINKNLDNLSKEVESSVLWFSAISGSPIPETGYLISPSVELGKSSLPALVVEGSNNFQIINLRSLEQRYQTLPRSSESLRTFGSDLYELIGKYLSPALGVGSESLKRELKDLYQQVELSLTQSMDAEQLGILYQKVLGSLQRISSSLALSDNGERFGQLRSVRLYREEGSKYEKLVEDSQINQVQLDKLRGELSQVVWYFNNQELSSRALEKQDPEVFAHWFSGAKQEWEGFSHNRTLTFKAPDQPRNLVLEKTFKSEEPAPHYIGYLFTFLPIILVLVFVYFVFSRQVRGMNGSAMSFGKSPARLLMKGQNKVTFADVAGIEEAKEELIEIVDFLKNPTKFTSLGGRIPKGVLLIGPPGTGKTLIAKAVSGEADRPFFSIAGSDFVEMFVGVGASRIRDMFEQAKRNAPCIIFIDEIDAVGRHRGAGIGGGHDEREQTLNQLLVEMDGFGTNEGVILMAATNRPDVLDKALLRPGRFDRRVIMNLPDIKGRFEILAVHAKRIKLDPTVDLMAVARSTPGASGADLENLLNEAALLAARKDRTAVTAVDVAEARDKVLYGKERRSLEMDAEERKTTAYHESGHAVVGLCVQHADPVDKVTIIPRGLSLGATHFLPEKNKLSYWKKELFDQLAVLMGGRAAEDIFLGDISSGAQQDISQATKLVRSMVCEWGMSEQLGTVTYDERSDASTGYGSYHEKSYSDETAKAIDGELRALLDAAYQRALTIIREHRDEVELMTQMLIEFETLDAKDVKEIMDHTWDPEKKRARLKEEGMLFKKVSDDLPPPPPQEDAMKDGTLKLNNTTT